MSSEQTDTVATVRNPKQFIRFDPTLNTGHLLQIMVLAAMGMAGYGAYQADRAAQKMELSQVQRDVEADRARMKESLGEIKADTRDLSRSMSEVKEALAVLKAKK